MSVYEIEIYDENVMINDYPRIVKEVDKILKIYGICKAKYYFSQCLGYLKNHIEVSYVHNIDPNTSLTIEFINRDTTLDLEKIHVEND